MTRDDILRLADKHATLTAGWMFSVPDMEDFYKHAYEAGVAAEREACAKVCESLITDGDIYPGNFVLEACAKSIRSKSE